MPQDAHLEGGDRRAPSAGGSVRVAWPTSARRGKHPLVERHQPPRDLRALIVLQEVAGLVEAGVGLADGAGDVVDEPLLLLAGTEPAGIVGGPDRQERLLERRRQSQQ